jgi:hypothetical protein
VAPQTEP